MAKVRIVVSKDEPIRQGDKVAFVCAELKLHQGTFQGKTVKTKKDEHLLFAIVGKVKDQPK